jgi:hypothetical protein
MLGQVYLFDSIGFKLPADTSPTSLTQHSFKLDDRRDDIGTFLQAYTDPTIFDRICRPSLNADFGVVNHRYLGRIKKHLKAKHPEVTLFEPIELPIFDCHLPHRGIHKASVTLRLVR